MCVCVCVCVRERERERERDLYEIPYLHLTNPSPPKIVETEASHTHTYMKSLVFI
jgi:hypothetical protein